MGQDRARYGPLTATIGAALLAVSVFTPWYGVSLTASGAATAQQALDSVARQFGNAAFQSDASTIGSQFTSLAGHQVATLTANDALKYLHVVLLILAGLAFLVSVLRLAGVTSSASGADVALVGAVAALCVLIRIADPPAPAEGPVALSSHWGAWLALLSSLAIVAGGLWPRRRGGSENVSSSSLEKAWGGLSGWTPEA